MKIGVMTDFHLGHRQYGSVEREEDFYIQLRKCCDEINRHDCDMVIIAGDIFDKPNPSPRAIHEYSEAISNLSADVILAIKGNHTMLLRDNHYAVDQLIADNNDIDGYFLLNDESWYSNVYALSGGDATFNKWNNTNIQVDGITYRSNIDIQDFIDIQYSLSQSNSNENVFRILVVHQSFAEFCGFTGEELSINDINTNPYDLIICGHIHSRLYSQLDNGTIFLQPGSIERLNITEARDEINNQKGIWVVDSDSKDVEFYAVEPDRKFFLGQIDVNKDEDIKINESKIINFIKDLNTLPIVAYEYYDYIGCGELIRDSISEISKYVLINNSNINDESDIDISIEILDGELPTIPQAIKNSSEDLSDEEKELAIDLHRILNEDSESAQSLLENYRLKHFNHPKQEEDFYDEELEELIEFFNNL